MNFYETNEFLELDAELTEAYNDGKIEDACDIFFEICQERKNFDAQLPDWYKIRWSLDADEKTWKEAMKIYTEEILNKP